MLKHIKILGFFGMVMLICLVLTGCSLLNFSSSLLGSNSFGNGSGLTEDGDTGGNSGATATPADELSPTESSLYETGPVELPIGMAKLVSPDADLIDVEVVETGISQSASAYLTTDAREDDAEAVDEEEVEPESDGDSEDEPVADEEILNSDLRFAVDSSPLFDIADGTAVTFNFTFYPGAIPDPAGTTPKVFVYNERTKLSKIVLAGADGSGSASVEGLREDSVFVSTMSSEEDQISPGFSYKVQPNGLHHFQESNSTAVSPTTRVFVDRQLRAYFVSQRTVGNENYFVLWQRAPNQLADVVGYTASEPRYVDSVDGEVVAVMLSNGELLFFVREGATFTAFTAPPPPAPPEGELPPVFGKIILGATGDGDVDPPGIPLGRRAYVTENSLGMIVNIPPRSRTTGEKNPYVVRYVPLSGDVGGAVDLVNTIDATEAWVTRGGDNKFFIAVKWHDHDTYDGYSVDMKDVATPGQAAAAWANRTRIIANFPESITYITAAPSNNILGISSLSNDLHRSYWIYAPNGLTRIIDVTLEEKKYSERFQLSIDGTSMVTCDYGTEPGQGRQLTRRVLGGAYPPGAFVKLFNNGDVHTCVEDETSYFIDGTNILHYLSADVATGYLQKARFDLLKFDNYVISQGNSIFNQ